MFNTTLSASFNYVDIAVLVIAVLSLLAGISRGLIKSLKGFVTTIIVIIGALFLTEIVANAILSTSVGAALTNAVYGWIDGLGVAFSGNLTVTGETVYINDGGNLIGSADALGSLRFFSSIYDKIVIKALPNAAGDVSMADIIVPNVVNVILAIGSFIVLVIVFKILFALIRNILDRLANSNDATKAINRVLGGVWGLVFAAAFIFLILGILRMFEDSAAMSSFVALVDDSIMTKALYDANPLFDLLNGIFGF